MSCVELLDRDSLRRILETFGWLDLARWHSAANYTLINYCTDDLTADEKLLTHYLCYITDRQMPFERVWDVGGYVISQLVRIYTRFGADVETVWRQHVVRQDGLALTCEMLEPNAVLARYGFTAGSVEFRSRFTPADLVCIWRTLLMLDMVADRSLGRYVALATREADDLHQGILRMAAALDEMTYVGTSSVSANTLDARMVELTPVVADKARCLQTDPECCVRQWVRKFKRFGKKRLWCSVRDYLKSPEFNGHLVEALKATGHSDAGRWQRDNPELLRALDAMELPGDVWNNSATFREGLFTPYIRNSGARRDMPRIARAVYDELTGDGPLTFYPEQLDVTFDFVPRLCEPRRCGVCPFGEGIDLVCHRRAGLWCSVALVACGYTIECDPDTCKLLRLPVRGLCHMSATGTADQNPQRGPTS